MMHMFDVADLASKNGGEYVLGSRELHTHACYFVYGFLARGEKGRQFKPGEGHEEIVCLIRGDVLIRGGKSEFTLKPGQAFHLKGEETFVADNIGEGDALYVISGGHSESHHE